MYFPITLLLVALSTYAAPTLNFPAAGQLPPVAYPTHPFNFTLVPSTFTSSSSLSYVVKGLPSWATFSDISLTFTGTPSTFDVGTSDVTIIATDSSSKTTTSTSFNLLVASSVSTEPYIGRSISSQLVQSSPSISSVTVLPAQNGVLVYPEYSFSLGFVVSTVMSPVGSKIYYQARMADKTPIPSWLTFDNSTVTFNGYTPTSTSPGSYEIVLYGSDVVGYGTITESFTIQVGTHWLSFADGVSTLKTAEGLARDDIHVVFNTSDLLLDGKAVTAGTVTAEMDLAGYDWLNFDASTLTLSGTPPDSTINGTSAPILLPVTFNSTTTGASVPATQPLSIASYPFTSFAIPSPTLSLTAGSNFSYSIASYFSASARSSGWNTGSPNLTFTPSNASSWIKYDSSSQTFSGTVPSDFTFSNSSLARRADLVNRGSAATTITLTNPSLGLSASIDLQFPVQGTPLVTPTTSVSLPSSSHPLSTSSSAASSSASADNNPGSLQNNTSGLSATSKIIIGSVIGGVAFLLLLALLIIFCCRRRSRDQERNETVDAQEKRDALGAASDESIPRDDTMMMLSPKMVDLLQKTSEEGMQHPFAAMAGTPSPKFNSIHKFAAITTRKPSILPGSPHQSEHAGEVVEGAGMGVATGEAVQRRNPVMKGLFGWGGQASEQGSQHRISTIHSSPVSSGHRLSRNLTSPNSFFSMASEGGVVDAEVVDVRTDQASQRRDSDDLLYQEPSIGSQASWEDNASFEWSDNRGEGSSQNHGNRDRSSIPKPRPGFAGRRRNSNASPKYISPEENSSGSPAVDSDGNPRTDVEYTTEGGSSSEPYGGQSLRIYYDNPPPSDSIRR